MLGKRMNNKETYNSMLVDKHIMSNKQLEKFKLSLPNLKIDDSKPVQLLHKQSEQDERDHKQFSDNLKTEYSVKQND